MTNMVKDKKYYHTKCAELLGYPLTHSYFSSYGVIKQMTLFTNLTLIGMS